MNTRCGSPDVKSNPLIFNGQDTTHGQWPWHAAVYQHKGYNIEYKCGGSLVGAKTIITGNLCYHLYTQTFKECNKVTNPVITNTVFKNALSNPNHLWDGHCSQVSALTS